MSARGVRLAAGLGAACLTASLVVPNSATASAEAPPAIAVVGTVPTSEPIVAIRAYVQPVAPAGDALGLPASLHALPTEAFTVNGANYTLSVDPADLPADFIDATGVASFHVRVVAGDHTWVTNVSARAVRETPLSAPEWVEAIDSAAAVERSLEATPDRAATLSGWSRVPVLSVPATASGSSLGSTSASSVTATDVDENTPEVEDDGVMVQLYGMAPATQVLHPNCRRTKLADRVWSTTIGTTYPVGEHSAKMVITSSQGANYGIGFSVSGDKGDFSGSGSYFKKSTWGKEWLLSSKSRSYRKGIEYFKYRYECMDAMHPVYYQWEPVGETGGNGSNVGITRPNWDKCAPQDGGPFWRDDEDGTAYAYGAAVKAAGVIGIDLSIKRQYSGYQKLYYNIINNKTKLCGNNGEWPSVSGKVMQKWK